MVHDCSCANFVPIYTFEIRHALVKLREIKKNIRSPNFTDYTRCVHRDGSISSGKNVIQLGSFERDFEIKSRPPILQDK